MSKYVEMDSRIYYAKDGGYDGNEDGVEWETGLAVHFVPGSESDQGGDRFDVYEDDGLGNGCFVASFVSQKDAVDYVNFRCGVAS